MLAETNLSSEMHRKGCDHQYHRELGLTIELININILNVLTENCIFCFPSEYKCIANHLPFPLINYYYPTVDQFIIYYQSLA